jgi:hypothetical protein
MRSLAVALALGAIMHLDWHFARPMDQRLSGNWSTHWLLAIPVFFALAWWVTRRWPPPERPFGPAIALALAGAVVGQVIEPLGEMLLFGDTFAEVYEPLRVQAFIWFFAAGMITLIVSLLVLRRRHAGVSERETSAL